MIFYNIATLNILIIILLLHLYILYNIIILTFIIIISLFLKHYGHYYSSITAFTESG